MIVLGKVIINTRNGGMIERGKHICLALKILDDHLAHKWVGSGVNHLLHSH